MAKKIRVHELAKELGLINKEALDLCEMLGIGVKTHSSSIEDAQADRVRRKADQLGMRREVQPEEPAKPAKGGKGAAAEAPEAPVTAATRPDGLTAESPVTSTPVSAAPAPSPAPASQPAAASVTAPASGPAPAPPSTRDPRLITSRPAEHAPPRPAAPMAPPAAPRPASAPSVQAPAAQASSAPAPAAPAAPAPAVHAPAPQAPAPAVQVPAAQAPATAPASAPAAPAPAAAAPAAAAQAPAAAAPAAAAPAAAAPAAPAPSAPAPVDPAAMAPAARQSSGGAPAGAGAPAGRPQPPAGGPPKSMSGKPIPPPPGGPPKSLSGKPIPPPPGQGGRAAPPGGARPGGPGARTGAPGARPGAGAGAPRPGMGAGRPAPGGGGGGFQRPGGGPGGGFQRPGGPGGGPGGPGGPGGRPGGGFAGRGRPPQRRRKRRRSEEELEPTQLTNYMPSNAPIPEGELIVERGSTAQDLGPKLNRSAGDVVRFLFQQGEMVTATMSLSDDMIELFAAEVGAEIRLVDPGEEKEARLFNELLADDDEDEDEEMQRPRPPVITVMGHVDHGKTLLLDRIRATNVVAGEAGGITQHIGAYQVDVDGRLITFIDTPGHEAFTAMRARGAEATDIVVLVVAADDGVMPQTIEAINHARLADVPIVVAVNKIDRENADPNRVLQQLSEHGLVPESWGGDTITVEISALQNLGIDDLLEQLIVVADVEELTANPEGLARGVVLESNLDVGRGPVATVLVQRGTLRVGDSVMAGAAWGRVRALIDDKGDNVKEAPPSSPVQVLGLSEVPSAGDEFRSTPDDKTARTIAEARSQRYRSTGLRQAPSGLGGATGAKLEDIFEQIQRGETAALNIILKADVNGSMEAVTESLRKLERDEVKLTFVHRGVGGITENDVQLAAAAGATIIGFNVRPDRGARASAEAAHVEIRTYEIIYKLLEDIQAAMVGMLKPEYEEVITGEAEVREIFRVPQIGAIAGCYVRSGVITRGSKVRFLREGVILWKGAITSLRRFKDDAREVREGFECGVGLNNNQDLQAGDIIETFDEREIPRT